MNPLLVGVAVFSFVSHVVTLYVWYLRDKPPIALITWAAYALFWAYLAVTEFFELEFATIGLAVLLVVVLSLSAVLLHRQWGSNSTQSA
ncbi:hypothetical protein ZOD2009_01130 [Haladaptatus paucihalophilus DX253]|uniref:Uncharacterized protein n=1 Tax=Haladaptatus paucihalophilus DX253 TaxID=797209 RepID=E7QP50_HALPU|nr:hypothetical protein [Haladaptatus paucihalophilus]EFW93703.1 hypothetical protein ZOD2009_01130 [Haladaptatus paucihalophilus DX253]SHL48400.1 hypothetical protein SAMN05444342_3927 [Haladaptatus paucihalophilus DX253]